VDDGSSDETFERLSLVKRRMTASGGHALVERLPQNVGKGEAVRLARISHRPGHDTDFGRGGGCKNRPGSSSRSSSRKIMFFIPMPLV
jgi:hypothetical protein